MNKIFLTEKDYQRLHALVQAQRTVASQQTVDALCKELKRACVVSSEEVPVDVVTMNSRIRLREMKSGSLLEITIVYPKDADVSSRKVSVLAPVGTAVLGCKVGEEIEWETAQGKMIYKVEEIIYQPEAAGNLYL